MSSVDSQRFPYYGLVPKDRAGNIAFRRKMLTLAKKDRKYQREFRQMCSRDMLFWINGFCFTYDPRIIDGDPVVPFITYPFQDESIADIEYHLGRKDIAAPKSRDMGASWMCLMAIGWRWWFRKMQSFLLVSRKEDLVDSPGNPDSLFWKLMLNLKRVPHWLRPRYEKTHMHLLNKDMGGTIDGESTTGNVGVGGRRTAILVDECDKIRDGAAVRASTRDNTACRIFNSTPEGTTGCLYWAVQNPAVHKIWLHWSLHPVKNIGMYKDREVQGKYPWELDGKMRSPWYDLQCQRANSPFEIAQQLDIDFLGSAYIFFSTPLMDKVETEHCRAPRLVGDLEFDMTTCQPIGFIENPGGNLKLWIHPDAAGKMPQDRAFTVGVDIATGTGSSNSVLAVADRKTGEKVSEWAHPRTEPHILAKHAVAMCRWFMGNQGQAGGAYLIWEQNGPGRIFGGNVIENGYRNLYYRTNETSLSRKTTDTPGWVATKQNKLDLLGEYRKALENDLFIERSKDACNEARKYIYTPTGGVEYDESIHTDDSSAAGDNHGDRVIASALACRGLREVSRESEERRVIPYGSFAWRKEQYEQSLKKAANW